ncbi:aspartic peptidase domain-containing protein [Sporodiniella umbellata]|nr:aspartic peptidase domain-containing protein [Sporodiniella umbellata]
MKTSFLVFFLIGVQGHVLHLPLTKYREDDTKLQKRSFEHIAKMYNDGQSQYLVNIRPSSDLWIPLNACPRDQCPLSRFDPQRSKTFRSLPGHFKIQYGLGSVEGGYGQDSVYLQEIHVPDQVLGLASSTQQIIVSNPDPNAVQANGILGLGYPLLASDRQNSFLLGLYQRQLIDRPLFAIYLGSALGWAGGEITLGGINKARYQGSISYVPIHENRAYWQVALNAIQFDTPKGRWDQPFDPPRGLILDTGTTLTYLDPVLFHRLLSMLPFHVTAYQETYVAPCKVIQETTHHHLRFVLQGTVLSIPIAHLAIPLKDGVCLLGIAPWMRSQPSQKMKNQGWIMLGDSVLRSTYLVFDMENHHIGFAKPNHSYQATSPRT